MQWKALLLSLLIGSTLLLSCVSVSLTDSEPALSTIDDTELPPKIPWATLWRKLNQKSKWLLEWNNGEAWTDKTYLLSVSKSFVNQSILKIALNFTSEEQGAYRLTFAVRKVVKSYVERLSKYQIVLVYDEYNATFDWSDIRNIPNLIKNWGVTDDYFWFRIRHNSMPANYTLVLDPTVIVDQEDAGATRYEGQRKVFRNPRNSSNVYAMFYYKNVTDVDFELRLYNSTDNTSWNYHLMIHNYTADKWESSDLWIRDTGTTLAFYCVYTDTDGSLYYRNNTVSDSGSVTLGTEQTVFTGDADDKAYYPQISISNDGYLHITYQRLGFAESAGYAWVDDFDDTATQWTELPSAGKIYLDEIADDELIYTQTDGAIHQWFSFVDPVGAGLVYLELYGYGDGNDKVNFYVSSVAQSGTIVMGSTTGWYSAELGAYSKTVLIDAELRVTYSKTGKANDIVLDGARLAVYSQYSVVMVSSTVTYQPASTDWSSEYGIFDTETMEEVMPKSFPLSATHDLLVVWYHHFWLTPIAYRRGLGGVEISWNGSVHTEGYRQDEYVLTAFYNEHTYLVVDNSTNIGYVACKQSGTALRRYLWTVGSGYSPEAYTIHTHGFYYALSIDFVSLPHMHYVFTISETAPMDTFVVRRKRVTQEFGSAGWYTEATVSDNTNVQDIQYFSAYWCNVERNLDLIYTREDTGEVMFYNYQVEYRFNLHFYYTEGCTVHINNTIGQAKTPANASVYNYGETQICNITGAGDYRYVFVNHTYDSSYTTNNPFYLTVSQNYTVWTYYRYDFDCNWIGMNSTQAGSDALISSNWEDLNTEEGVSHWRISTNNTGSFVNSSWSNVWRSSVWADHTLQLNSTVGVYACRFFTNDSSGIEYVSTYMFYTTYTPSEANGFDPAFYLLGCVTFLPLLLLLAFRRKKKDATRSEL